jgi:hypothetical protein
MIVLLLLVVVRQVVAVNYVDCSSDAVLAKIDACVKKYNAMDANNSATACAYFTNVAACVPAACCSDVSYYISQRKNNEKLASFGIKTCQNACGGPTASASTDLSCDDAKVDMQVRTCGTTVPDDEVSTTCAHYMKVAECIPSVCCAVPHFVGMMASYKATLGTLGLSACSPMCGPKLAGSGRVTGGAFIVILLAATACVMELIH